jgi:predicted nucleotidyltransferase component of viral defense system
MIPARDLSLISNALLKQLGGRRVPDQTIELDYALGWFLCELSAHPISASLAFKGGTALRRCHFGEYRFSEDLDFTLLSEELTFDQLKSAFEEIAAAVTAKTGMAFRFSKEDRQDHLNSHTFYMAYTGPMRKEREFKVDITRSEVITGNLDRLKVLTTYPAFDFPSHKELQVYSIDEIATEKILALTDPKRSQPRDLFDIWTLVNERDLDLSMLTTAIAEKLRFRNRTADGLSDAFDKKEKILRATWKNRLDPQMTKTPEFEAVFRAVRQSFKNSAVFDSTAQALNRLKPYPPLPEVRAC